MIEILVVVAIVAILTVLGVASFGTTRKRARDVQRKSDLTQIKTSLALYYNVWNEYPDDSGGSIVGCGTAALPASCAWGTVWSRDSVVYMKFMPSDPLASNPQYSYDRIDDNNFTIKALLETESDKDIAKSQARCSAGAGSEYVVCQD